MMYGDYPRPVRELIRTEMARRIADGERMGIVLNLPLSPIGTLKAAADGTDAASWTVDAALALDDGWWECLDVPAYRSMAHLDTHVVYPNVPRCDRPLGPITVPPDFTEHPARRSLPAKVGMLPVDARVAFASDRIVDAAALESVGDTDIFVVETARHTVPLTGYSVWSVRYDRASSKSIIRRECRCKDSKDGDMRFGRTCDAMRRRISEGRLDAPIVRPDVKGIMATMARRMFA